MAIKNFSFTVDTININNNIVANVKQLDNAIFNITITENSQLKDLTNQVLKLFVKKADGSILVQTDNITLADAANGKITININNSIFATAGIVIAEIDISGTDGDIATATFSFNVYEKIGDNAALEANTDIDLFKQITDLMSQATKEIEQYKTYFTAFNAAGVTIESLNDIKTYINNNLAGLKTENDTATNLSSTLQTDITAANTAVTNLENAIKDAGAADYLTAETLTPILDKFTPYMQWNGISSADCNTLVTGGFYSINAMTVDLSTTHFPINGEWGLLLVSETHGGTDGGTVIQIFYGLTTTRLFYRMFNDSSWRDWAEIVTAQLLNTNLDSLKSTLETEITNNSNAIKDLKTLPSNITANDTGIILEDNTDMRTFMTKRTVNDMAGVGQFGIDSEFNAPVLSLQYFCDNTQYLTLEMLKTCEFKFKDNTNTGTSVLLFTDNIGDTSGKGYIGVYNKGQFTVKSLSGDLVLDNNYGSTVNVGAGGYFYPTSDGQWALGKNGYRWSNIYTQNITNSSDEKLKDNIKYLVETPATAADKDITIADLYNFVKDNLKLASYDYTTYNKDEEQNNKNKIGFIAQDFLKNPVGQSIVHDTDSNGFLTYDLNNYISLLAGALQKAINNIESLQTAQQISTAATVQGTLIAQQVTNLMLQNIQLAQRIAALESKLSSN